MLRCSVEITSRCVGLSNSSNDAANYCRRSSIAALGRILAQEVFLRVLKYRPTYRDDGGFETWLFRIARSAGWLMVDPSSGSACNTTRRPVNRDGLLSSCHVFVPGPLIGGR